VRPSDYVKRKRAEYATWLAIGLVKLAYKVRLWVFKSGTKLRLRLLSKLKYQLRLSDAASRSEGFDEVFDKVVHIAACRLLMPEIFDSGVGEQLSERQRGFVRKCDRIRNEYERNKEAADNLVASALRSEAVKATVTAHALVEGFCAVQSSDDVAAKYYLALAQKYDPEARSIDFHGLRLMARQTRKELRSLRYQISDREAIKIPLSSADMRTLASLASAFFLLSGYLYNYFLLGHFGIDVSKYFSLSDYLASSMDAVWYSASGAAIALVYYFLGMHSASRRSFAELKVLKERRGYVPYLLAALMLASAVQLRLAQSEQFYTAVFGVILIVTYPVVPWVSRRFFKEPLTATLAMVFVISFSGYMYESIARKIYRIEHGISRQATDYAIKLKNPVPIDGSKAVLIDANSSFLFLRGSNKEVYIVPRGQVEYVSVRAEKASEKDNAATGPR
jgi:hypothetical protein